MAASKKTIQLTTSVAASYAKVRRNFDRSFFQFLAPPWVTQRLLRFDGQQVGHEVHLEITFPQRIEWISQIVFNEEVGEHWTFIDVGKKLPWFIASWHHRHQVIGVSEGESLIKDDIEVSFSSPVTAVIYYPGIWATMMYRKYAYPYFFKHRAS